MERTIQNRRSYLGRPACGRCPRAISRQQVSVIRPCASTKCCQPGARSVYWPAGAPAKAGVLATGHAHALGQPTASGYFFRATKCKKADVERNWSHS